MKKKKLSENFHFFFVVKYSVYLNRHVCVMIIQLLFNTLLNPVGGAFPHTSCYTISNMKTCTRKYIKNDQTRAYKSLIIWIGFVYYFLLFYASGWVIIGTGYLITGFLLLFRCFVFSFVITWTLIAQCKCYKINLAAPQQKKKKKKKKKKKIIWHVRTGKALIGLRIRYPLAGSLNALQCIIHYRLL